MGQSPLPKRKTKAPAGSEHPQDFGLGIGGAENATSGHQQVGPGGVDFAGIAD